MPGIDNHSTSLLIHPLDATAGSVGQAYVDPQLEPAFLTAYKGKLHLDAGGWVDKAKAYYTHAIARTPAALLMHVQRICLYVETADPAILDALIDLFLVLGNRGTALRKRMLVLARPILSNRDFQALHQQLMDDEPDPAFLQARSSGAVLSRGITGTSHLIIKRMQAEPTEEDPLDSARQQIEIGQIELAQKTLESAILVDPARLDLHHALLEIYRHARDWKQVDRFWRALQGRENPARVEWLQLLTQLEEER
jgi:hypothetical protein